MRNASYFEVRARTGLRFLATVIMFSGLASAAEGRPARFSADLAEVYGRHGEHQRACELYREALAAANDRAEGAVYRSALADELLACSDQAAAKSLLMELTRDQDLAMAANANIRLAKLDAAAGAIDDAVDRLHDVAADCPIHELRRSAIQLLVELAGKHARANDVITVLRERLATEDGAADLLEIALRVASPAARVALAAAAVEAHPDDPQLRLRHAEALAGTQRYDEAVEAYRQLAQDVPDLEMDACEGLARIAAERHDIEGLVAAVEQAAAGMSDDIERDLYMNRQYAQLGAWEQAAATAKVAYDRAANLGPAMRSAAGMELGEALMRLGRVNEAKAVLAPIASQSTWHELQMRAQQQLAMAENNHDESRMLP